MVRIEPKESISLRELAFLAGATEKALRHELEDNVLKPRARRGKTLLFGENELLFIMLLTRLKERLGLDAADRRALFELVARTRLRAGDWRRIRNELVHARVPIAVRVDELNKESRMLFRRHLARRKRVTSNPAVLSGEPVFKGTRISVQHVGELLQKGVSVTELLADYPPLSRDDLEFARLCVELGPPPGRPRRRMKIRRGLLN